MDTGLNYTYKRLYWRRPVLMEAHRGSSLHPSAGHWEKCTGSRALSHCWSRWRSVTGMKRALNFRTLLKKQKKRDVSIFLEILFLQKEMIFLFHFFFLHINIWPLKTWIRTNWNSNAELELACTWNMNNLFNWVSLWGDASQEWAKDHRASLGGVERSNRSLFSHVL